MRRARRAGAGWRHAEPAAAQSLRDGRPQEAVAPLRQAAQWQPGNAAILHDRGPACLESGQIGEAIAALKAAIAAG